MISRLMVANRGEIARRVIRTCRALGISPVVVCSDPDADAPFVAEADAAVRLPGASPTETYLRAAALVAAARAAGADAVHPGYGFLSENAAFARAVLDAGLTWVGPDPDCIEAMGSKIAAKKRMAAAGVPVLPELDPESVTEDDLPVLVKASAGGGGRGMRTVRSLADLPGELAAARAEAASAFGDGAVFCEPLLTGARHVEVQVLADAHGTVWALGERECSIQRRHQKIVEETPSPAVDAGIRARLCEAAVTAARAIGYVGAGTVEFLLDDQGRFHFLEVNTRLQVEHPVTECVYGMDLVAWQLAVAEGERLPAEPPAPRGHAIEVRLYAEDPAHDWRPASGRLLRFEVSDVDAEFAVPPSYGLRLDAGVASGSEVGVHYDPMLAKVIAWAPNRTAAARRLAAALAGARVHGLTTNRELLVNVLRHPEFLAGRTDTAFLDRHGVAALAEPLAGPDAVRLSALAAALAEAQRRRATARVQRTVPAGWRNLPSAPQRVAFRHAESIVDVEYRLTRDGLASNVPGEPTLLSATEDQVVLDVAGVRHRFAVAGYDTGDGRLVAVDSPLGPVSLATVPRFPDPDAVLAEGATVAPMPGTVLRVAVREGDRVDAGAELLVLEAMKMEHRVTAAASGVVTELPVRPGQQVDAGTVLAVVSDPHPERDVERP
ncbi:acetyl/propionyl/methylcrotonyl-CoA carboxylase subunit alpha [Gandjariella thermophila]|uniref:Acetyl/propionyl-CoA carboxylase subuit alpha n=1 Tax=Gandjariella thermophila TaxID=1931992 RepID=A0A4D4J4E4_9PSEU|nr:biotin carboxylase N-terminal domain-containing protein [Gandjariella thermophila]GDY28823.1 acetyl/propionyl-CoA carboxylase subuit alpha [Gandjariella thermophila]